MTPFWTGIPWQDLVAVALVAGVLTWIAIASKGTRSVQIAIGLAVVLVVTAAAGWLGLLPRWWRPARFWPEMVLAFVILFQHELRRILARIGRNPFRRSNASEETRVVEEIVKTAVSLANRRIGAILVVEREDELFDVVEVGTPIDARISKELLVSVFLPYSPLHDGAVILRGQRVVAAGCFLPLSARTDGIETSGTRHRAALGITEETDAVTIVISEETGTISIAIGGDIQRDLDGAALRQRLFAALHQAQPRADRHAGLDRVRS
jgi:diadenylate cyclase